MHQAHERHIITIAQANHGGVKGRLPEDVVNQDPLSLSQQSPVKVAGRHREETEDSDSEEQELHTPPNEEEVLNQSDDEEDTVRTVFFVQVKI